MPEPKTPKSKIMYVSYIESRQCCCSFKSHIGALHVLYSPLSSFVIASVIFHIIYYFDYFEFKLISFRCEAIFFCFLIIILCAQVDEDVDEQEKEDDVPIHFPALSPTLSPCRACI